VALYLKLNITSNWFEILKYITPEFYEKLEDRRKEIGFLLYQLMNSLKRTQMIQRTDKIQRYEKVV